MYALFIIPVLIIIFIFGYLNSNKKIDKLIELSDQGNKRAEENISKLLNDGFSEKRYNKICSKHYLKKAYEGDCNSQYMIGKLFSNSKEESLAWLTKAANNGKIEAMREIAYGYSTKANEENPNSYQAFGIDNSLSVEWYKKASATGDNLSMYELALYYFNDKENKDNLDEAVNWFIRAAENGYIDAYIDLGKIYSNEKYTKHYNIDKSIDMFYHAIDYGLKSTYVKAVYNLGLIFTDLYNNKISFKYTAADDSDEVSVDNTINLDTNKNHRKAAYCFSLGTALGDFESERMLTLLNYKIDEDTRLQWENEGQSLWFNKNL